MLTGLLLGAVGVLGVNVSTNDTLKVDLVDQARTHGAWEQVLPEAEAAPELPKSINDWLTLNLSAIEAPAVGPSHLIESEFHHALSTGWGLKVEMGPARHKGSRYIRIRHLNRKGKLVTRIEGRAHALKDNGKDAVCYRIEDKRAEKGASMLRIGGQLVLLETFAKICLNDEDGYISAHAQSAAMLPFKQALRIMASKRLSKIAGDTLADVLSAFPQEEHGLKLAWRIEMAAHFEGEVGVETKIGWFEGRTKVPSPSK